MPANVVAVVVAHGFLHACAALRGRMRHGGNLVWDGVLRVTGMGPDQGGTQVSDSIGCPECKTPMHRTKPDSVEDLDIFYAQCPGCGYEETPEKVRSRAQSIVDAAKAKRQAKKLGK